MIHSSLVPRGQPLLKSVAGQTRTSEKAARKAQDERDERECYRAVDERDQLRCRVTGVRLSLSGDMTKRVHRHHMIHRSRGGQHLTSNVITVSPKIHDEIHVLGTRRLSGDADVRDERGRLCGVRNEVLVLGSTWEVIGLI